MVELLKAKEIVERPETADRLRKCKYVMGTLYATDASDDYTFQNAYREFYDLEKTYSENFKTKFFYILEEMKDADSLSFRDALERLYEIENTYEMKAASMLLNTVNPRFPVWDKDVAEKYFDAGDRRQIRSLLDHLDRYLTEPEKPSLLHGDLWGGNYMTGDDGKAWLIDPAAYYGHPEADLAMTQLFGGFSSDFYEAYKEAADLESGYADRRDLYNLYIKDLIEILRKRKAKHEQERI